MTDNEKRILYSTLTSLRLADHMGDAWETLKAAFGMLELEFPGWADGGGLDRNDLRRLGGYYLHSLNDDGSPRPEAEAELMESFEPEELS